MIKSEVRHASAIIVHVGFLSLVKQKVQHRPQRHCQHRVIVQTHSQLILQGHPHTSSSYFVNNSTGIV